MSSLKLTDKKSRAVTPTSFLLKAIPLAIPPTIPLTIQLVALMAFGVGASDVFGGDLLPQGRLDASGTGTVPVATPMKPGYSKFTVHAETFVGTDGVPAGPGRQYLDLDRMNRFDLLGGVSIFKGLDLHLGLHGTYERRGDVKSQRVSSGSALVKLNLIRAAGFNLALAPYIESGIGEKGEGVYTRSVKSSGGIMMLAGYAVKNSWEWHLALGNRNRASEDFDGFSLGHEFLYKTSAKLHLSRQFGVTLAADGRQLRIQETDRAEQHTVGAGRGQIGVFYKTGSFETSVYGGASIDRALGREAWKATKGIADFDGGALFYGLSMSMSLGGEKRDSYQSPARPVRDVESNNSYEPSTLTPDANEQGKGGSEVPGGQSNPVEKPQKPESFDNDFLNDFSGTNSGISDDDDFNKAAARVKRQQSAQPGAYDIGAVEKEIERLREAERKADEARQRAEEARMERERKINAQNAVQRAAEIRRLRNEVRDEVDALPTITTEDMSWQGLE